MWYSGGVKVNPAANDILADSGAIAADQSVTFKIIVACTVAAAPVLEHRNAANDTNLHSHIFPMPANGILDVNFQYPVPLATNERIRVRINAGITGQIQASLLTDF
jgi:hypothetical protein